MSWEAAGGLLLAGATAIHALHATKVGAGRPFWCMLPPVAWLGSHEIGRDYVVDLFEDLQIATVPTLVGQTAAELNDLLGTMSFWARLSPAQRDGLVKENHALQERLGHPIRASTVAALVTARRRDRSDRRPVAL